MIIDLTAMRPGDPHHAIIVAATNVTIGLATRTTWEGDRVIWQDGYSFLVTLRVPVPLEVNTYAVWRVAWVRDGWPDVTPKGVELPTNPPR